MIGQWMRRLGFGARQGHLNGALSSALSLSGARRPILSPARVLGRQLCHSALGKGLLAGCASLLLASGASPVQAAAYATGGNSPYRDQVLWLTWGGGENGKHEEILDNGATSSATRAVAGNQSLQVDCTLGNVSHDTSGAVLTSYRPGNYNGDSLNLGYNIGGANNNQLVSGIARSGGASQFQVTCAATLGGNPFQIKGLVMADAESINGTAGSEYVQASAQGQWHVVEMRQNGTSATYIARKTGTGLDGDTQTIRFGPGTDRNTAAVTFLAFDQQAYGVNDQVSMDFDIKGGGTTAIAIGLLVPYADFGDAPSSYGEAMHLIDDLDFRDDHVGTGANVNLNASTYDTSSLGLLTPPSNYLGTTGPDAESSSRYSADGRGDESGSAGASEENAWPAEAVTVLQAGKTLSRTIACNGTGTVAGWIDFNRDGKFESTERAEGACRSGVADLSWTVPALADLVAGNTFVRLRYALDADEVKLPTGLAKTGEVEDHLITIVAPELSLAKTSNAGADGWVVGQSDAAYTLTVTNQGQIATNETAGDEVGRITVLDQLPTGILPNWTGTYSPNGWSCTADAARLVTCSTTQIIAAQGASQNTSQIQLPVQVTAAAVGNPTNYASVGGGRDLNNNGLPPTPDSTCNSHCASVTVTVKAPAITVSKTANPASGVDVFAGDSITYTLSVTVANTATLSPVVLTDTLGAGLTFGAVTNAGEFTPSGVGNQRTFTLAAGKAPGTYNLSYTATVASGATTSVQNEVTASGGGDPDNTNAPAPSCTSCNTTHNVLKPSLTIDKTAASPSGSTVGSTIAYSFLVSNPGNVALGSIAVVDDKLATAPVCPVTTLAAGANMTCSGTYTLTQADIDAGEVENSAYARGTPSGSQTPIDSPPDSVTTTLEQNPSLTSAKAQTSNADEDGSNSVTLNDTLTYTVTVTNTGNVSLTNVVISDSKTLPATRTCSSVAPGASCELVGTYKVTQADVNDGKVLNTATVTTDTPGLCASSQTLCKPSTEVPVEAYEIEAANDSYGPVNGHEGGNPGNVLDNDSLNDAPVVSGDVVLTPSDPAPNDGVTLNVDGSLQVLPGTPAGTYTIPYQICESANPVNCATAQATVVVGQATIAASNDDYPQVDGAAGDDNVGNVLGNDSLNGETIDPAEVGLALIGSLPPELTFNAGTGVVGVKPETPAGDYSFQYEICEKLNAQNCAVANVTVSVEAADIVANDDTFGPVNGRDGGDLPGNVLDNDTLGGDPVNPSKVTLTPNDPAPNDGVTLNNDGTVTIEPSTPAGQYPITYQICEILNPSNCDTATVTVTVEAPPIEATDDGFGPVNGSDGNTNIGNVLDNDTLGGEPIVPGDVQLELVGNLPPGLTFDTDSGVVGVPPGTPAGDYSFQYKVCEKLNPANCDTASVTVTIEAAPILAEDDAYGPVNQGAQGVPLIGNVLDNDRLNGAVVTPQEVTLSGTPPAELSFDPSTGAVGVNPGTPAGLYSFEYRICEKLNPSNCADATVTVEVQAMAIAAIDDDYTDTSLTNGAQGGVAGNVLGNDSLNGLGGIDLAQVRLEQIASSIEQVRLDPASGDILVAPGTPSGTYTLRYRLIDRLNPGNYDEAVVTVAVSGDTLLNLTKQATPQQVKIGDLVRYTLVADNTSSLDLDDVVLLDSPPAGFSLVADSLSVSDRNGNWSLGGINPIRVSGLSVAAGGRISITYFLRVGAGAAARGEYVNTAQLLLNGLPVSNNARASVTRAADPLFEDSRVWGTVFHDRDGDGWQDSAKATGLQVSGGFAPDAYVADSTSVDRGEGLQPEADASSPLLHGLQLGTLEGRRSPAEPENARRIVISQRLHEPTFTDDFSLSTAEGTVLRMNAAGEVSIERRGDAARGLTGQDLSVERRLSPAANGEYRVDYIIVNRGINERGLPGVRIGTVEGLLVETDAYGRFHLEGLNVEHIGRGRNFIMKVDAATLPSGSRFTSENPLVKRITQGMPTRFDFAVQVPEAFVAGSERVDVELGEVLFEPGSAEIRDADRASVAAMQAALRRHGGGEVNIVGHAEDQPLALRRAEALRTALLADLSEAERERVTVTLRPESGATLGLRGERVLLGQVLFGTDQARLRSEYAPLLDELARLLTARLAAGQGGAELIITGHADARGSAAYNQALGMRRARVVFDALAARLSAEEHSRLRVEIDHSHDGEGAQ